MLISHRHQFIYTKTHKTAGTSVESYFEPFCMTEGSWEPAHERDEIVSGAGIVGARGPIKVGKNPTWWNHMPAPLIRERLGDTLWNAYFKFCVVRNPFEKMISAFYFRRRGETIVEDMPERECVLFERWLHFGNPPIDRDKYLIDGKSCLDFFVRYERLEEDLQKICRKLELPWDPARLPIYKSGIRPTWATAQKLYTSKSRERIETFFALELKLFGYSFPTAEEVVKVTC